MAAAEISSVTVVIMRHGDRADDDPTQKDTVDRAWDPHLTNAGLRRASDVTTERLLPLAPFDRIVSSPFLRCLQTACVARTLLAGPPVSIDNGMHLIARFFLFLFFSFSFLFFFFFFALLFLTFSVMIECLPTD
jgi:hypothetical protein